MKTLLLGVLLTAVLLFRSGAGAAELEPLDYVAYFKALPQMEEAAEKAIESIRTLNRLLKELEQTTDDTKASGIRAQIRPVLVDHRALKEQMIALADLGLKKGAPERANIDVLKKMRNTVLRDVSWKNVFLKYVARDISQAMGIPVNLNPRVQELNQVEVDFPEISALGALDLICENFDLKWIIWAGEIFIVRKLNPNEARFLEWEKKHGTVDWIGEDEAKTYEDLPVEKAKRLLEKLEGMDLPLLRQRLTKMYILEGESKKHETRLAELKLLAETVAMFGTDPKNPEEEQNRIKRHKHILHYLKMEKENSIEVWDIINQVLGDRLKLDAEDEEIQKLLGKLIPKVEWVNKNLEDALYELGQWLNVPVEVDLPPFADFTVNLSVENVTAETVINLICDIHPLDWRYVDGRLFFAHVQGGK